MATNNREVELKLKVSTNGAGDVKGLATDLRSVANEGNALDTALESGADSLAKLSAQTKVFRAAENEASAAVAATKRTLSEQSDELKRLQINYRATGGDAAAYKAQVATLSLALVDGRAKLREQQDALNSASAAAKAAALSERALSAEIERSAKTASKATADTKAGLEAVNKSSLDAASTLRQLGPLLATAFSAQEFIKTIAASESLSRSFEQIFGSAGRAREELEFIRGTANRLGLENLTLAQSYQSLSASTKGTVLEGQATRDVFEAVSRAMSTLGKSSAQTERALTAISQIASKGTASMEELRGQLGEALPGALKAAADGAGITTEQLIQMVSSGDVLARDILPALTKGLNDLYAKAPPPTTIISEFARFKNVLSDTAIAVGEGGASKGLTRALSGAALAAQGFSAVVDILGVGLGETAAAIVTGNRGVAEGEQLTIRYAEALRKTAETAGFTEKAQTGLNAAQSKGAQTAAEAFRALELATNKQAQAGESLLSLKAKYSDLAKGSGEYTKQLEREVQARTAEGSALVSLVNLFGSEADKRAVLSNVTETQSAALKRLAQSKDTEAIIAQSLSLRLQEEALRRNDNTEATKKEIAEAQKSAQAKQTESEAAKASAVSKRIEAEAAKVSAAAYADNTTRVYEFRAAAVAAQVEVERLTALQKQGKATDDQVTEARIKAAGATRLYRDALADASAQAERRIVIEQQQGQAAQAVTGLELERAKAAREVATANGDATKAGQLQRQESTLQVTAYQQEADAARKVAAATRELADRKEAELRATGQLTAAKRDELDAQRRNADLLDIQAQKSDILAQKTRELAESEKARTAVLEQQIAVQEKAIQLEERQRALDERKRTNRNTAGEEVNQSGETLLSIVDKLKGYGLDDKKAQEVARQFTDSRGNVPYDKNPGVQRYGTDSLSTALEKAASDARYGAGAPIGGKQAGTQTVNINLGGRVTPVNVASQGDADSLVGFFKELQAAKGTAQ